MLGAPGSSGGAGECGGALSPFITCVLHTLGVGNDNDPMYTYKQWVVL